MNRRQLLATLGALAALLGISIVGVALANTYGENGLRVNLLPRAIVVGLHAACACLVAGLALESSALRAALIGLPRQTRLLLTALLLGAVTFVAFQVPRQNRILFDEHIHQNIGQSIMALGEAVMCNNGEAAFAEYECHAREVNKQPNGYGYYLAWFYRLFGAHEWVSHAANNVALLIGLAAIAGIALALWGSVRSAVLAAALYAGTPLVLRWSNTAAVEPSAAAFAALAVWSAVHHLRRASTGSLLLAVGATSFACHFRYDTVLVLLPLALFALLNHRDTLLRPATLWGIAIMAACLLPLAWQLYAFRNFDWGSNGQKFGWAVVAKNFHDNGWFYLRNERYPVVFTALALVGLIAARPWRVTLLPILWALLSWAIFLSFYAGSYNYGVDERFSLMTAAPLAVLAAAGSERLLGWLDRRWRLGPAVVTLAVGAWLPFLPLARVEGEEGIDARHDVEFARSVADRIPDDALVFAHQPSIWLVLGKNAAQTSHALVNDVRPMARHYTGGLYFHWNYWCSLGPLPPEQYGGVAPTQVCGDFQKRFDLELVEESFHYRRVYRLYRVRLPTEAPHDTNATLP